MDMGKDPLADELKKTDSSLRLYTVGGQNLFPIYGASGGLESSLVFYVVRDLDERTMKVLPVRIDNITYPPSDGEPIKVAMAAAAANFDRLAHIVGPGCELGIDGLDLRKH